MFGSTHDVTSVWMFVSSMTAEDKVSKVERSIAGVIKWSIGCRAS